ncbi:hypothetical protein CLCAR_0593 [Clostridium carboxidivorans P7]|nr:hypothetical protein CLCAR_0593 [Clostridium carboxidivorans P7]
MCFKNQYKVTNLKLKIDFDKISRVFENLTDDLLNNLK